MFIKHLILLLYFLLFWILDFGAYSHICTSPHDLVRSRLFGKQKVVIKVGSRASVLVIVISTASIKLSSSHVLV